MITLQEISGYLPYGVMAYDEEQENKTDKIVGIFDDMFDFENWSPLNSDIKNYKVVLRPLFDLTKEIEINGENITPIIELAKIAYPRYNSFKLIQIDELEGYYIIQCLINKYPPYHQVAISLNPMEMSFKLVQKLFEWHFDIFGLIERGDAIDINTLK